MARRTTAHLFSWVNGVVESPNLFQFDAFGPEESELMGAAIGGVTDVVIGRALWQEWSQYWPGADDPFAQFINPVRKHVVRARCRVTSAGTAPSSRVTRSPTSAACSSRTTVTSRDRRRQRSADLPAAWPGVGARMYPIGYALGVAPETLLVRARLSAGLTQAALADASGTSRPTLSAYECGRKSPTLGTAARILAAAGLELGLVWQARFVSVSVVRGRPIVVPTRLPRLPLDRAMAVVELPLHLNWSDRGRRFDLRDRRQRGRVYEIVLREGSQDDVVRYIDAALLMDLWDDLVLPSEVRAAWEPVLDRQALEVA